MSARPIHADSKSDAAMEQEERIILERLATYDQDKKDAKPWSEVKADILQKLKHPQPR